MINETQSPMQLSLFSLLPEKDNFSNTIELYDAIPKYILGKNKYGERLDPLEREFQYKNIKYKVIIHPARLKNKDGVYIDALPGQREEFVEDALRKIAVDGNAVPVGNQIGVHFTMYRLKQELERTGHTYSSKELRDAIKILSSSHMELKSISPTGKHEELYSENLFPTLAGKTKHNWDDKKTEYIVVFHSLVKKSIMELSFRRYNYDKCMQYKSAIARYLHKRMSHNFLQASMLNPYEILASSIVSGSGMKRYAKLSNTHKYISDSLDELCCAGVLQVWKSEKRENDIKYTLTPSASFVGEIKRTNQISMLNREKAKQLPED